MPLSLAQMRRNYTLNGLLDEAAPDDPLAMFRQWLQQARDTECAPVEANSMMLATVDSDGQPHCRVLLLKGLSDDGFTFFGNYQSDKGLQLAANPNAAMTFFWPGLERQVRIEGQVSRLDPQLSDAYFDSRSVASRLGFTAKPAAGQPGSAGFAFGRNHQAFRWPGRAATAALGWLLPAPGTPGVLAGACRSPA